MSLKLTKDVTAEWHLHKSALDSFFQWYNIMKYSSGFQLSLIFKVLSLNKGFDVCMNEKC